MRVQIIGACSTEPTKGSASSSSNDYSIESNMDDEDKDKEMGEDGKENQSIDKGDKGCVPAYHQNQLFWKETSAQGQP